MSYAIKYQYDFKTLQGDDCIVYFFFKDYSGGVTYLNPGVRPFVLREFNQDNDFFKPIRGQQAELQIVSNNVQLDDFLFGDDDAVQVQFFFNGSVYWIGWLMQDDFQEDWTDSNHYITLRATDGLGQISEDPKITIDGLGPVDEYLSLAISSTPIPTFLGTTIINHLFYDGMNDASGQHPLNQVYIDGKTFEKDNNQQIVEKINKAWSQTLYQYLGKWWFVRQEQFLHSGNISGIIRGAFSNSTFSKSFTTLVGVNEDVKPIQPFMLRQVRRPSKETKIDYRYEFPDEIICNQTFLRGDLIVPTTDTYTVECWTLYKTSFGSPVAGTADFYRKEEKDGDGNVTDNYVFIESDAALHYIKSQGIVFNANDTIEISFDYRVKRNVTTGPGNIQVGAILFEGGGNKYTLDTDGNWVQSNASYTTNFRFLNMSYTSVEDLREWKNFTVRSKALPTDGTVYICLVNNLSTDSDTNHKGLEVTIREASKQPGVVGDFDRYTLTNDVRNNFKEQTYLDDSNNRSHKGALFFENDLTGDNWYRKTFNTERFTFKRHKAIAHMLLNKRYRNRLEVTMYGIKNNEGNPIGLMNRFQLVDDAPNKLFMLANLSEIDFSQATWKGNLIEVYDTDVDSEVSVYPDHDFGNIYAKDV